MSTTPTEFTAFCEEIDCNFSVVARVDSGAGEKVAKLLDNHMQVVHDKRFPSWLGDKR